MVTSAFVLKLNERNLCTWYVLPLLGLNPMSFIEPNFIDSFMVKDKMQIAVRVMEPGLCPSVMFNPFFKEIIERGEDEMYLLFEIDPEWEEDIQKFIAGKYSKFSEEAKKMIRELSGLTFESLDEFGTLHTSAILLALDQAETLKDAWIRELEVNELPEELMSVPSSSCFIEL